MTDDAFLYELQDNVTRRFYSYLNTGTLTSSETTWQRALAMAKGRVINKFKQIHRTVTNVVGFVNVLDLYDYLATPISPFRPHLASSMCKTSWAFLRCFCCLMRKSSVDV